jgi:hypothetical protein
MQPTLEDTLAVYIVTYDLISPGKDYAPLLTEIRKYTHCDALKSAYFIDTRESAVTLRDKLKKHIDANDKLYVLRLRGEWAASRSMTCTEWLNSPARNWT